MTLEKVSLERLLRRTGSLSGQLDDEAMPISGLVVQELGRRLKVAQEALKCLKAEKPKTLGEIGLYPKYVRELATKTLRQIDEGQMG